MLKVESDTAFDKWNIFFNILFAVPIIFKNHIREFQLGTVLILDPRTSQLCSVITARSSVERIFRLFKSPIPQDRKSDIFKLFRKGTPSVIPVFLSTKLRIF